MKCFLIVSFLFLMASCTDHNSPEVLTTQKSVLSTDGQEIGKLPDGRKVVRYQLSMGSYIHDHFIYVVEGGNTISVNHTETHGKSSANHVEVIIDGSKYELIESKH